MPCLSDYLEPSAREKESNRVYKFLIELGLNPTGGKGGYHKLYGNVEHLDADTRRLCAALKKLSPLRIKDLSLRLQLWWERHQMADKKRVEEEESERERRALRASGLAKLTKEERMALGLKGVLR